MGIIGDMVKNDCCCEKNNRQKLMRKNTRIEYSVIYRAKKNNNLSWLGHDQVSLHIARYHAGNRYKNGQSLSRGRGPHQNSQRGRSRAQINAHAPFFRECFNNLYN